MKHVPKGCLTGEPLNVIGTDSARRVKRHRRPDAAVKMRHKRLGGRDWFFWVSDFRIGQARGIVRVDYKGMPDNVVDLQIRRLS